MDAMSCLAPPPSLLAGSFADAAIARALHFSMSADSTTASSSSSASAPLLADLAYAPAPAPAPRVTCGESVLVAVDSPRRSPGGRRQQQQNQLGPAGARAAGKRRSRASKRAPTTYISTDPANFRIMVQQITGAQPDPGSPAAADAAGCAVLPSASAFDAVSSSMLLAAAGTGALPAGAFGNPLLMAATGDASSLHHHNQEQQPCFPTLDSWNVMYERS
ncbi:hypothetical protein ACP70R_005000 [Stipagrostis hirtigluma subsp. patula]